MLGGKSVEQVNHTVTIRAGTLRGMLFQCSPHAETKFVSFLWGGVYDVAVDLCQNSPSFLRDYAEILSADNHKTLVIPEGFAHVFSVLTWYREQLAGGDMRQFSEEQLTVYEDRRY